uniref:3-oxoacyl-[acyl-carrier-protein] reductase FabG n=1 Tax=Strongyloides venezuelensis TaxID=75913 RepID=A0A0K0G2H3_STRVS
MESLPVAVITGASSGIGRATAIYFAGKKYRLALCGRNEEALNECVQSCLKEGITKDQVTTTIGDLREEAVGKKLIENAVNVFGRIDVLVNAAGILVNGCVDSTPITEYDRQFDVNVRSIIVLTQFALPYIKKTKGAIVNVSSVAGTRSFPNAAYYCMSKAALDQFTKCLALEVAPEVRVNSVNPGVIVTEIHKRAGMDESTYAAFLEKCKSTHILGRAGEDIEVAKAIYFLASDMSSFTTGELLHVDGGRNLMCPR